MLGSSAQLERVTPCLLAQAASAGPHTGKWLLPDISPGGPSDLVTDCAIPRGKILFAPIQFIAAPATRQNIAAAPTFNNFIVSTEVRIDGRVAGTGRYVTTPVFDVVLPRRNVVGAPPGLINVIAGGYVAMLSPLSPGTHTVVTSASLRDPEEQGSVTYHLTVR